jgi:hypothetical protein
MPTSLSSQEWEDEPLGGDIGINGRHMKNLYDEHCSTLLEQRRKNGSGGEVH